LFKTNRDWWNWKYKQKAPYIGGTPENNTIKTPLDNTHQITCHHLKTDSYTRTTTVKMISNTTRRHYSSPKKNTQHQSWATSKKLLSERSFSFHHPSTSDPPKETITSPKPKLILKTDSRSRIKVIGQIRRAPLTLAVHQRNTKSSQIRLQLDIVNLWFSKLY